MKTLLTLLLSITLLSSCTSSLPITHGAYRTHAQEKSMKKFMSYKRHKHKTWVFHYGYINHPAVKPETRKNLIYELLNF